MKRLYETFLTGDKKNSVKTKTNIKSQRKNIVEVNCCNCHYSQDYTQDSQTLELDILNLPNKYGSFQNLLEEKKMEHEVIVKKLYSSEQLSCKYNYFLNKLI